MMNISYLIQKVFFYMQNPEQQLPIASDARQAAEIEKMRKAVSDIFEAKREIFIENQNLAAEVVCLEFAKQMLKDQQRGIGQ